MDGVGYGEDFDDDNGEGLKKSRSNTADETCSLDTSGKLQWPMEMMHVEY